MSRKRKLREKAMYQKIVTAGSNALGAHSSDAGFWDKHRAPLIKEYNDAVKKDRNR